MRKILFIICDGLGDRPDKTLGGKTPLEAAATPNMDELARRSVAGLVNVLGKGIVPHSDDAHLTIFGYDIKKEYPGRGPIEAAGVNIKLQHGDVAMRANVATVDNNLTVMDRRAGRVEDTEPFVKHLDGIGVEDVRFIVKPGTGYRAVIVMRGNGLSDKITSNDPDDVGKKVLAIKPTDGSKEAAHTAQALTEFLDIAAGKLSSNPLNNERRRKNEPLVNYMLVRGAGFYEHLESFEKRYGLKACCIAGAGLYKGIGAILGMDLLNVKGATGLLNTDVGAKIRAAVKALERYDFVFVHIKPTDSLGEDGNAAGKRDFIEKIDKAMKPLLDIECCTVITADHSTPCADKHHSADPPPIIICGSGRKPDGLRKFSEKECAKGSLGVVHGRDVMKIVKSLSLP